MTKKIFNEDDYCDVHQGKICDNCGDCLELEGIDTKAIKIKDIAKKIEENEILKEKLKTKEKEMTEKDQCTFQQEIDVLNENEKLLEEEYEDAFDHIEYIEDLDLNDDLLIEENTEEIYPGVRRLKRK
ncbi:hypothetical protein [Clostridium tarantellae]|uniref:Uncharacterized protein n=1 Tax=Clostridium tarantellae TaxID=39493 RepID=A0A6I1MMF0_9CLOT|nr:hypothetical protein [Clostridium tarantellae]MPQ44184.1 hypothetical protein [Clostridium tarantellae]